MLALLCRSREAFEETICVIPHSQLRVLRRPFSSTTSIPKRRTELEMCMFGTMWWCQDLDEFVIMNPFHQSHRSHRVLPSIKSSTKFGSFLCPRSLRCRGLAPLSWFKRKHFLIMLPCGQRFQISASSSWCIRAAVLERIQQSCKRSL